MSEEMKNVNEQPTEAPVAKKPLDKKTIGIIAGVAAAVVVLAIILIVALGGNGAPADTGADYTLGLGVAFGEFKIGEGNMTVATVVLDKDGKIVACRIDAVQNKFTADFDNDAFTFTRLDTKMELGTGYGMGQTELNDANSWMDNDGNGKVLEWDQQAKAFETWCVGKTIAQVEAAGEEENLQNKNGHLITTDEALLNAGCSIQISDFVKAVVNAGNDASKVTFKSNGTFTLGIAANSSDNGSKVADDVATIKMNVDIAAVVVADGKIVAALNDAAQPQIVYDYDGNVTDVSVGKGAELGLMTKRALKENYGMGQTELNDANSWMDNDGNGKVLEWYVQSAAFSNYVVGKTGAQVKDLETKVVNDHNISTDEALLNAGCSIDISGLKAVVAEAVEYAR